MFLSQNKQHVQHCWNYAVLIMLIHAVLALSTMGQVQAATGSDTCGATTPPVAKLKNSAFVFVKPHANTEKVRELVVKKLENEGIEILSQVDINGEEIDSKGLIDQHYYSIASKATILSANEIPVPSAMFLESFGEDWEKVLEEDRASNAIDACKRFGCSPEELNKAWRDAKAVKFGGGFYCGTSI